MKANRYSDLLREVPPEIIHDAKLHQLALAAVDALMKKSKLSVAEGKLLDLLAKLIDDYEEQIYPTPVVSPREVLQRLLENSGLSPAEFARKLGLARSTISEVLKGKRRLSVENAFRLTEYFHVEPSLFWER